jgi:hypothetical protein
MAASPYATATPLGHAAPSHVTKPEDIERIRAYVTYEAIWDNVPEAFEAMLRAGDDPISRRYVPVVRDIIEATNRYLAIDMETTWTPNPGVTIDEQAMLDWRGRLAAFWAREEVGIKFLSSKRYLLIKGDSLLHLTGDIGKEEGKRVRLTEVEPEQYFPIYDPADGDRVMAVYLVSIVQDDEGEDIVQRIEYRKISTEDQSAEFATPVGQIFYRMSFWETDGWDDREPDNELKSVNPPSWAAPAEGATSDPLAGFPLAPAITTIPVYHIRNRRRGGKPGRFGTSEIQGLETVFAGIIQNTTDEDLAVAMQGLGVYWTDSGKSRDETGAEIPWEIGPASVAELEKDGKFGRVAGVGAITPIQDHIDYLMGTARGANGAPEIASGTTQSSAQISGVALRIQFMPTLSANGEREVELASKWTHLLYDLMTMWFPVYEGWNPLDVQPGVVFGDPLPPDREAVIREVTSLLSPVQIVTKEWAATYLAEKLGYDFPPGMTAAAAAEAQATLDAEGARIAAEAGQVPVDGEDGE